MSTQLQGSQQDDGTVDTISRDSRSPLIEKDISGSSNQSDSIQAQESTDTTDTTSKPRKRDFWKLGKKNEEDTLKSKTTSSTSSGQRPSASHIAPIVGLRPNSPLRSLESMEGSISPHRHTTTQSGPGSPAQLVHSNSPRPQSPASSMIFERNVQEDVLPGELSPSIPSHVITENHIPPALDASAEAITNEKLDPDTVEIVTHATHQPAGYSITGTTTGLDQSLSSSMHDDFATVHRQDTDNVSNYGNLDSTDVRRLSFISFADVVHAEQEHGESRRDSAHLAGGYHHHHPSSIGGSTALPRSPSPMRSPVSSSQPYGTSPPTSVSNSIKGSEAVPPSPIRVAAGNILRGPGSPFLPGGQSSTLSVGSGGTTTGDLNIETMSQALRRTGSGDLSTFRSASVSAVGNDDGDHDHGFR